MQLACSGIVVCMDLNVDDMPVDNELKELFSTDQHEACKERCKILLSKDPLNMQALLYMAYITVDHGEPAESVRYCDTIILGVEDRLFFIWNVRGRALALVGRYDEAKKSFMKSLSLRPTHQETYLFLAFVHYLTGNKEHAFAILDLVEIELQRSELVAYVRGLIEKYDGNTTEALVHFVFGEVNLDPASPDYERTRELFAREVGKISGAGTAGRDL